MKKRKAHRVRIKEGVLRDLYRILIAPLVRLKHESLNLKDYLENIFCVKTRLIYRYEAVQEFEMPGLFCVAPTRPVAGLPRPLIKVGDILWVRIDTKLQRIDVELPKTKGGMDQIYRLDFNEFREIQKLLKHKPFRHRVNRVDSFWEA